MQDAKDSLFPEEDLQSKVAPELLHSEKTRFSIAYLGPELKRGRMNAVDFGDGVKGFGKFVDRVAAILLGRDNGFELQVEGGPRAGSVEVFLNFFHPAAAVLREVAHSETLSGLAMILALTGFSARDLSSSLISIFKKMRGRPITDSTDLAIVLPPDPVVDRAVLIRMYNDPDVQAAIRAAIKPLRTAGIIEAQTRVDQRAVERITKGDVEAADIAELAAVIPDEERSLEIEKVSFVPHLAWHLSDGGKAFDAKVDDPVLWARIASGERFGFGDRLHVTLHTEAEKESNGRLKLIRTVTKVHSVERTNRIQLEFEPSLRDQSRDDSDL